jgi:hypothetical protein
MKKENIKPWLFLMLIVLGCNSEFSLKPKGYFRIEFPKRDYVKFNQQGYPYTFEYPSYARIEKDSSFFKDNDTPFWINISFPSMNGKIYCSYKKIGVGNYGQLVDDAYKMTYKHSSKATEINDSVMLTPQGISGIWFRVGGNAATGRQFFVTDSTRHFLRGALYFDATPNEDSLGVVYDFLQEDMKHLINTLQWKN